jgi:hypothetical protein
MPMGTLPADADALMERYRAVAGEAMVKLHRLRDEREQWESERAELERRCDELERSLKSASADRAWLTEVPLQATLEQAIEHVDRILEGRG